MRDQEPTRSWEPDGEMLVMKFLEPELAPSGVGAGEGFPRGVGGRSTKKGSPGQV